MKVFFWALLLGFTPIIQGCEMTNTMLIQQIILKPAPQLGFEAGRTLPEVYVAQLQSETEDTQLSYKQAMSMGLHLLMLSPALERESAEALTKRLTERDDVEYAEPDLPRCLR
ncbi:MAG: hypothetical protein CR991_03570 [Proteobacteria bacterium]|nr:MAG: hypothetical protein CR991_03570 [Pseudomonadota bacterium]